MLTLVEFEWELLEAMAGQRPALEWGGAVGAALGCLKGLGYVELDFDREAGKMTYRVTQRGLDALAARKRENWTHCPVCKERVTESEWHRHMVRHG